MKRILITIPHPSFHGGVGHIYKVLKLNELEGIEYFYNTEANKSANVWNSILMLLRFIRRISLVDIVHINPSYDAKAVIRDGMLLLSAKLLRKTVVIFFHGWDDNFEKKVKQSSMLRATFSFVFNKADAYILLGEVFNKKLSVLGVKSKLVFYLPTIADDEFINRAAPLKQPSQNKILRILFIGGFVPSKGMDIVINAFKYLKKADSGIEFELTMAGDGPELKKWKQYVIDQKIDAIHFPGYVTGIEKHNLFEGSDILLFPSNYAEGLPCVIMEAMLYGLVVVTRPIGGIPYWVKHNVNGWLSDSMDPEVFAEGIQFLVSDPDLFVAMRKANSEIAISNFTPDRIKSQLMSIYDTLLNKNGSRD